MSQRRRGSDLTGIVVGVMCLATVASAEQRPAPKPSLYDSRVGTPSLARVLAQDANTRPIELRLTSRFAISPATMRSLVRVAPHEDNRKLRVEIDSPGYFSRQRNRPRRLACSSEPLLRLVRASGGFVFDCRDSAGGQRTPRLERSSLRGTGQRPAHRTLTSAADLCRGKRQGPTSPLGHEPPGDAAQDFRP